MIANLRYAWRGHKARWRDERCELAVTRQFIRPGSAAFDIGAHKGNYLYWLSKWASDVVAFEPQPHLAAYLRTVAGPNVRVEAKGVYSKSGTMELAILDGRPAEASFASQGLATRTIAVNAVTLDSYSPPTTTFRS